MLKAVIFDIDGTLLDSVDVHAECWVRTFAHFGVETDFANVRSHIGESGDRLMPAFLGQATPEARQEEIQRYRTDLFKREYFSEIRAFPKVRDLLERIRADGRRIVLASSCAREEIGHYKELAGISDLVDCEVTADDARSSKPAPDIFFDSVGKDRPNHCCASACDRRHPLRRPGRAQSGDPIRRLAMRRIAGKRTHKVRMHCFYRDPADLLASYDKSPIGTGR